MLGEAPGVGGPTEGVELGLANRVRLPGWVPCPGLYTAAPPCTFNALRVAGVVHEPGPAVADRRPLIRDTSGQEGPWLIAQGSHATLVAVVPVRRLCRSSDLFWVTAVEGL